MIYLICQDWRNTTNNHAGMKYLCKELERRFPTKFMAYIIPYNRFSPHCFIGQKISGIIGRILTCIRINNVCNWLDSRLQEGDEVFLMEYMGKRLNQYQIAHHIKLHWKGVQISAIVHLVPQILSKDFNDKTMKRWIDSVDRIITFGHSLTDYLIKRGAPPEKVHTSFHYVDDFYQQTKEHSYGKLKILVMGNQMRNISLLNEIVRTLPEVNFTICQGTSDLTGLFHDAQNVTLIPFLEEYSLREEMEKADISLNIMIDTIGSNVIVTSMAMGLAMICSDVGSIRDYCDDSNCLFCHDVVDFKSAILKLNKSPKLLKSLQNGSLAKAKNLSIDSFITDVWPQFL